MEAPYPVFLAFSMAAVLGLQMNGLLGGKMKRDYRLDLIRSIAIFMIFTFHFCCTIGNTGVFYGYANDGWGSVGTTMFFILSGFLLGNKYHGKFSVQDFYVKRWFSIFPLFYLTFAVAFLINGLTTGNWRYGGSIWRFVFTLLGCDNYLGFYGVPTYALVGEWFTAVIVLVKLPWNALLWKNMLGFMIFGMLFFCGGRLEGMPGAAKGLSLVSRYSYAAYLCHHFILSRGVLWVGAQFHEKFGAAGFYLLCLFVTGLVSALLYKSMELLKKKVGVLFGSGSH